MKDKTKLLILFGGVSSEHEVSRVSASSILTHINGGKYEIYTVGITKEGNWFLTSSPAVRIGDGSWEQDPANKNVALSLDRASRGLVVLEDAEAVEEDIHRCGFPGASRQKRRRWQDAGASADRGAPVRRFRYHLIGSIYG